MPVTFSFNVIDSGDRRADEILVAVLTHEQDCQLRREYTDIKSPCAQDRI